MHDLNLAMQGTVHVLSLSSWHYALVQSEAVDWFSFVENPAAIPGCILLWKGLVSVALPAGQVGGWGQVMVTFQHVYWDKHTTHILYCTYCTLYVHVLLDRLVKCVVLLSSCLHKSILQMTNSSLYSYVHVCHQKR